MKEQNIIEVDDNIKLNKSHDLDLKKANSSYTTKKVDKDSNIKNVDSENGDLMVFWYIFISFIMFFALIYFFFFIGFANRKSNILASEYDITKPHVDDRKYRAIKLENGIEVLLISDHNANKNAVSLTVGAGSFQDDEELPGLAHIVEHSILAGSYDYPRPSEFEDLLAKNFGSINSFTEDEKTTFYFESDYSGFEESMKIFSRLFANPKLDINLIPVHLLKIEEELKRNVNKDQFKELQIIKNLSNPTHPFSRFSLGDLAKLKNRNVGYIHSMIKTFYFKFYTPINMKLSVISSLNIELLENKVTDIFSKIRSEIIQEKNNRPRYGEIPNRSEAFTDKELNQIIWYKRDSFSLPPVLDFVFILNEINTKNSIKPLDYISYLIKYRGKNSLMHNLKKHNLATSIDSGIIGSFKHFSQFAISITLTNKGTKDFKKIIEIVFTYIEYLKNNLKESVNEELYRDISQIFSKNFHFWQKNEKLKLSEYLNGISINMFDYPAKRFVAHDNTMNNFNTTVITDYLNNLSVLNSLVIIGTYKMNQNIQKFFDKNVIKKDKYFNTEYVHKKLPKDFEKKISDNLEKMQSSLALRKTNKYITTLNELETCVEKKHILENGFISLKKEEEKHVDCEVERNKIDPKLIFSKNKVNLWYKLDRTFWSPKVNFHINIPSEIVIKSVEDSLDFYIFFKYIKEMIEIKLAEAVDAGNEIDLSINENGINLYISAYSDLIRKISEKLFTILFDSNYIKKYFTKENYFNYLESIFQKLSHQVEYSTENKVMQYFRKISKKYYFSNYEILNHLKKNLSKLKGNFNKSILKTKTIQKDLYFIGMIYGNIKDENLNIIVERLENYFSDSSKKDNKFKGKNKKLKSSKNSIKNKKSTMKLMNLLHSHSLIDGSFIYRTALTNSNHTFINKNLIGNFYQVGRRDIRENLMMTLVELIWGNLFKLNFRKEKNKPATGNVIASNKKIIDNIMYYVFIVESHKETSPEKLNLELDKIINKLYERIDTLELKKFDKIKESVLNELKNEDSNLSERSSRAWNEVYENTLEFSYKENLVDEIDKIGLKDIMEFFKKIFISSPKKLSIQLYGNHKDVMIKTKSEEENYGSLNMKLKSTIMKNQLFLKDARTVLK